MQDDTDYLADTVAARKLCLKADDPENADILDSIGHIIALDFSKQKAKFYRKDSRLCWSKKRIAVAELQYKCFLYLRLKYGRMPPTETIDEFWHGHILDTERYISDCNVIFGGYHHHYPYRGLEGPQDRADWRKAFKQKTQKLYKNEFGSMLYEINY